MNLYFFDTSAVVKVYVKEIGTAWVRSLLTGHPPTNLFVANITKVELTSAVVRRRNTGSISAGQATTALIQLRGDFPSIFSVIMVTSTLIDTAEKLAETHALRAYDAVQLAVLLQLVESAKTQGITAVTLISADTELNNAAVTEGVAVDDPNSHP